MKVVLSALALVVAGLLAGIVGLLLVKGWDNLTLAFLWEMPLRAGREGGIRSVLISTGLLVGGALTVAVPLGVAAALYLSEYAGQGAGVKLLRALTEALAGIPSIVFGLFGFSVFVIRLGWGWSLGAGSATLSLMLLPTVIRTAEEALITVPREMREGAAALGAAPWQSIWRIVLPAAMPGIATGAILALGRALGETAAVLLTAGSDLGTPTSVFDPGRSLAVHLYILASEALSEGRAYATAFVLVVGVLVVNLVATLLVERGRRT